MKLLIAFAAMLSASLLYAQHSTGLPYTKTDAKCARAESIKSPSRTRTFWNTAFTKPLEQRFGSAPVELVEFLNLDNIAQGYPNTPHAATLSEDFARDVRDAIAELPALVKSQIDQKLAGIYFVKDLGGTGYTDYVRDDQQSRDAGLVVLDMDVLSKQTANAWATWKENTPFKPDARFRLEATIEPPAQDTRKNAIQYILLHELAHIMSIGESIHPVWDKPPNSEPGLEKFPFANLSWQIDRAGNRYSSRFDAKFPERTAVVYYLGAKLDGKAMVDVYEKLEQTNFPTLYAATKPGDDFAESFVSYVHTVIMKRPWEIRIFQDGKLISKVGLCWEEERCAEKRRILEDFLGLIRAP